MENLSLDKVMRKIAKLKNLYEGAKKINSMHEAECAAAAMNKLLAEYNLTLEEVESSRDEEKTTVIHEEASGFAYKLGGMGVSFDSCHLQVEFLSLLSIWKNFQKIDNCR